MRDKPKVGDELFLVSGNFYIKTSVGSSCTVTKVGNKYFYIAAGKYSHTMTFRLEDWSEKKDFGSNHSIYLNEQQWIDEKAAIVVARKIADVFCYGTTTHKYTLEQLEKVSDILELEEK